MKKINSQNQYKIFAVTEVSIADVRAAIFTRMMAIFDHAIAAVPVENITAMSRLALSQRQYTSHDFTLKQMPDIIALSASILKDPKAIRIRFASSRQAYVSCNYQIRSKVKGGDGTASRELYVDVKPSSYAKLYEALAASNVDRSALARRLLRVVKGTLLSKKREVDKPVAVQSKSTEDFALIAAVAESIRSPISLVYFYLACNNIKNKKATWQSVLLNSPTLYPPVMEGASRLLQRFNDSVDEPAHSSLYRLMNHHIATYFSQRDDFVVNTQERGGVIQYTRESPMEVLEHKFFQKCEAK